MKNKNGNIILKNISKRKILKKIWEYGTISRAQLAKDLDLSPATVSTNVGELVKENYIIFGKEGTSSGGRKPIMLEINENSLFCIGVTVKKYHVISILINLKGNILSRNIEKYPLMADQNAILDNILKCITKTLSGWQNSHDKIIGIGVGMHGVVDHQTGISIYAPAFDWHYINIKRLLENNFSLPVYLDNDARVMLFAEKWFGNYRSLRNAIFMSLDEGVGGGLMVDGKVYRGVNSASGEIGHIRVKKNGKKCICGNYGCLETVASAKALVEEALEKIHLGFSTIMTEKIKNDNLDEITFSIIKEAAEAGDSVAISLLEDMGLHVGAVIAHLVNFMNPEAVFIGGMITETWDFFKTSLRETVVSQSMTECRKNVKIIKASFPEFQGELGAAAMVINKILEEGF